MNASSDLWAAETAEWRARSEREWQAKVAEREQHQRAIGAVRRAVVAGELPVITTRLCVDCGGQAVHYHHNKGYETEHWLDVVPVCLKCHLDRHVKMRALLKSPSRAPGVDLDG